MKRRITIAVDFDGTLCEDRYPEIGEPKTQVIESVKRMTRNGARVILHTCRSGLLLDAATVFCVRHGIKLYAVNCNPENEEEFGEPPWRHKMYADYYIDDRAVTPEYIEDLLERTKSC
jgi:hypothetical protein